MTIRVTVPAWSKLNLVLSVGERQPDGFHELDTVFVALQLHDDVHLEWTPSGDGVSHLTVEGDDSIPTDGTNLAWKAAELALQATAMGGSVGLRLVKRIPAGGGLGGGSANAAAVLGALNSIAPVPLPYESLLSLAGRLGSDVPFALHAMAARAFGRGQKLVPLRVPQPLHVVVVVPDFAVSTPWCYQQWKARPLDSAASHAMARALMQADYKAVVAGLHNDLEPIVAALHPQIAAIKNALVAAGCDAAMMTGSGSCVFGLASTPEQAQVAAGRLSGLGRVVVTQSRYDA